MPLWMVLSPKYDYTEWVCEYGGPTYEVQDYTEVEAQTAREAIVLAVAHKDFSEWVSIARSDGVNPMVGVKATMICPACLNAQMEGVDNYECEVCGYWWRSVADWSAGKLDWFRDGNRYETRERYTRIRRFLVEHPDYPA